MNPEKWNSQQNNGMEVVTENVGPRAFDGDEGCAALSNPAQCLVEDGQVV